MDVSLPSREALKAQAKRMRAALADAGTAISHSAALEAVAAQYGYRDWNTAFAAARDAPRLRFQIGDTVRGRYLGQPFSGRIKAAGEAGDNWRLTLVFDEAVDVVTSAHFSNFRKQVNCTVNGQGVSPAATSDGEPQMRIFLG